MISISFPGHHASLLGSICVEDSPEIITCDVDGTLKLWDIRNFQCIQTTSVSENSKLGKIGMSRMSTFTHLKVPSENHKQKDSDSKIFVASKKLYRFTQEKVVFDATSDSTGVIFIDYNEESSMILTVSEKNLIIWDALTGSPSFLSLPYCRIALHFCCFARKL